MPEPLTLTDADLDDVLHQDKPVLLLISNGDGLRGDFRVAFNKAAQERPQFTFARIDPDKNPQAAARFGVGDKPMLIAVYCGDEIVRRMRPWGSDLPLAFEMLDTAVRSRSPEPEQQAAPPDQTKETQVTVLNKPIDVTDATFEQEVLNSDLPVMVDFWAAWCGPCRMVAPSLEKLAGEFAGQIKIAKVDVDANPGLSQAFRIMSIPNLMIVKERTIIFNQPGALPEASLRDLIQQAIKLEIPKKEPAEAAETEEQPAE